ncbi:hypothetical protein C8R42DRAFT_678076 [Lentinula raphanica]|nr:hypothetical protein C8R42DRAFT_678076 [Lentinula raphanica]
MFRAVLLAFWGQVLSRSTAPNCIVCPFGYPDIGEDCPSNMKHRRYHGSTQKYLGLRNRQKSAGILPCKPLSRQRMVIVVFGFLSRTFS